MNEYEFLNVTNGIDERFVDEYIGIKSAKPNTIKQRAGITMVLAAAVILMVPIGVYAFNALTHKNNVSVYYTYEGAQKLEQDGLANGFTIENEQMRLTLDTMLCDGNFASGVFTLTAITDEAKKHLESATTRLVYADTGEVVYPTGGGSVSWYGQTHDEWEVSKTFCFPVKNSYIDSSRAIRLEFLEYAETGEINEYGDHIVTENYDFCGGLYFDLPKEPNVPIKMLFSSDGYDITLSPYGVSHQDEDWKYPDTTDGYEEKLVRSFAVITNDGERTIVEKLAENRGFTGDLASGSFCFRIGTILNIDDISGVEINGVEYTAN